MMPLIFLTHWVTSLRTLLIKSSWVSSFFARFLWVPLKCTPNATFYSKCCLTLCSMLLRQSLRWIMSSLWTFFTPFFYTSFSLTDWISIKGMQTSGFSGKLLELSLSLYISKASLLRIIHLVNRFFYLSTCLLSSPSWIIWFDTICRKVTVCKPLFRSKYC
jgi:hypothetical protein